MIVNFNGKYLSADSVKISPFDHGFLYGLGAFETFRTYNGHPFLLKWHLERLEGALKQMAIQSPLKREMLTKNIKQLLEANGFQDAVFRLNVSAGQSHKGLRTDYYDNPNLLIIPRAIIEQPEDKELVVLHTRRNTPEGDSRIKSHHFFNSILGARELSNTSETEGIQLNANDQICEGTMANIFWIKNGVLFTPSAETGLLKGVTRRFVLQLAEHQGMRINIGHYKVDALHEADEIFMTNSVQEIMPIRRFEKSTKPGKTGVNTLKLKKQYHEAIINCVND